MKKKINGWILYFPKTKQFENYDGRYLIHGTKKDAEEGKTFYNDPEAILELKVKIEIIRGEQHEKPQAQNRNNRRGSS